MQTTADAVRNKLHWHWQRLHTDGHYNVHS